MSCPWWFHSLLKKIRFWNHEVLLCQVLPFEWWCSYNPWIKIKPTHAAVSIYAESSGPTWPPTVASCRVTNVPGTPAIPSPGMTIHQIHLSLGEHQDSLTTRVFPTSVPVPNLMTCPGKVWENTDPALYPTQDYECWSGSPTLPLMLLLSPPISPLSASQCLCEPCMFRCLSALCTESNNKTKQNNNKKNYCLPVLIQDMPSPSYLFRASTWQTKDWLLAFRWIL